jgi:DNA-binding transcriptional LysR family regulator
MDLKQITYFMWVYEEGSFSRAAARANVVQSALSLQIRRIEDEFGILLFNRLSRGVEPTEAGRKFYERCVPIARNFALAQEELSGASDLQTISGAQNLIETKERVETAHCSIQERLPTIEARRDSSIQLPSGSRIIDIRATSPSVTGARPSRTPLRRRSVWIASISVTCSVM